MLAISDRDIYVVIFLSQHSVQDMTVDEVQGFQFLFLLNYKIV